MTRIHTKLQTQSFTDREMEIYNLGKAEGAPYWCPEHKSNFDMVAEFHDKFGQKKIDLDGDWWNSDQLHLQLDLINEECDELMDGVARGEIIDVTDAIVDVLYVTYGAACKLGLDADAVFREVHRSNMSKLGEDGLPILRKDGKIMKGPNYSPPDIAGVLGKEENGI